MSEITHREVIDYLKGLRPDMRELVLELARKEIAESDQRKVVLGARLAKARRAKGKKTHAESRPAEGQIADPAIQAEVAEQIPIEGNARQLGQQRRRQREQNQAEVEAAAVGGN